MNINKYILLTLLNLYYRKFTPVYFNQINGTIGFQLRTIMTVKLTNKATKNTKKLKNTKLVFTTILLHIRTYLNIELVRIQMCTGLIIILFTEWNMDKKHLGISNVLLNIAKTNRVILIMIFFLKLQLIYTYI